MPPNLEWVQVRYVKLSSLTFTVRLESLTYDQWDILTGV